MSSAALPASTNAGYVSEAVPPANAAVEGVRSCVQRRRPNQQQGRALEMLGHAIEYLIDSRLYMVPDWHEREQEAVQILMSRSRAVFAECEALADALPLGLRVGRKVGGWLCRKSGQRGWKG